MFASAKERRQYNEFNPAFPLEYVVQFRKGERESEIICDDIDHALRVQKAWIDNGASYVEIFRVLFDGTLNPTIGAYNA